MSEASEHALNCTLRDYILDNKVDGIAKQINGILCKIQESGASQNVTASKWLNKLRKLFSQACRELETQNNDITNCIDVLEAGLKNGGFQGSRSSKKRKRENSINKEPAQRTLQPSEVPAGSQVAAKIARSHDLWILASIVKYVPQSDSFEIEDEDSGDEGDGSGGHRHHLVQAKFVLCLPKEDNDESWTKYPLATRVLAMYPNTTSFYPATVSAPNPKGSPYVVLKFDDDDDETGKIPDRRVPFRFVVTMPSWLVSSCTSTKPRK